MPVVSRDPAPVTGSTVRPRVRTLPEGRRHQRLQTGWKGVCLVHCLHTSGSIIIMANKPNKKERQMSSWTLDQSPIGKMPLFECDETVPL